MIESLDGTGDPVGGTYLGNPYKEDMDYRQTANAKNNWTAKQLPGVTKTGDPQTTSDNHVYFYYTRNSYNLNFHNPGRVQSHSIKFGSDISGMFYTPTRPSGVDPSYSFAGWYTDLKGDSDPFIFTNAKMPERNLALYAKWSAPEHKVKYYLTADADSDYGEIENIPHGGHIEKSQLTGKVIPDGLTEDQFEDWFWYIGSTFVRFDFNLSIDRDGIELYPVWNSPDYQVTYDAGGA
ncbi:MAG: InlB B-repeat-containing protein, partial [Syntrophomonadaceae bacterium]|nr:InlB B-repeat-containing protein [Syntrophomonadaceae bacterium]